MELDIKAILDCLPHRYPMLLIDRVLDVKPGESIVALKNVSINEPYFPGHFPHYPVMPGVLILEALAQAAAIMSFMGVGAKPEDNSVYYFAGIDGARFRRPVMPGDQLRLEVDLVRSSRHRPLAVAGRHQLQQPPLRLRDCLQVCVPGAGEALCRVHQHVVGDDFIVVAGA